MKNIALRSVSGLLYVALIVGTLLYTDAAFMFLCMAFGIFGVIELSAVTSDRGGQPSPVCALDIYGIMCLLSFMLLLDNAATIPPVASGIVVGVCYLIYMLARMCAALYMKEGNATRELAYSMFGQMYIGIGLLTAQYLCMISTGLVLLTFILIWLNDTGAFLVGSAIGKHRLFERLSPKKSWEGFFGGLAVSTLTGIILAYTGLSGAMCGPLHLGTFGLGVVVPVTVCVFSTLGDLLESMIKRSVGVKDSGKLIPGHGGILDRIDSMLFAMPAVTLALMLFSMISTSI
ncbi:MAG: phosphatidate cytidylyltransferase [Muribaculaceae bacterium]|nr:phosphatidate cytidylyltransferase [Muribaculaceae bacterium]